MKIKVSELTDAALDWAVARCQYPKSAMSCTHVWILVNPFSGEDDSLIEKYSTDWSQGGPIIDRELIAPEPLMDTNCSLVKWSCRNWKGNGADFFGPTFLIAAMRCYVASKLGNEVEIPEELT